VSILTLRPIDPDDPPEGFFPRTVSAGSSSTGERRHHSPSNAGVASNSSFLCLTGKEQHVDFHEVSPTGADEPPRDAEEQARFVRLAYALVACKHPIPSDADVRYQVWW
jgi:hypothetical protein